MRKILLFVVLAVVVVLAGCSSSGENTGAAKTQNGAQSDRSVYLESLRTGDISPCSEIGDKTLQQGCYFYNILENGYPDKCSLLEGYYGKICIVMFGNKESVCENPEEKEKYSYFCTFSDSESLRLDLLHGLFKTELRVETPDDCEQMKTAKVKDLCYLKAVDIKQLKEWEEAMDKGNYDYVLSSELISFKDRIVDPHIRDLFIKKVATLSEEPKFCTEITDANIKKACEENTREGEI